MERAMFTYPLNLKTTTHNHVVSALVSTCTETLGRNAPWTDWMTTCCSLTLTTTVRVINRIHNDTTDGWTHTAPAHCTRLTDRTQTVLGVTNFAQRSFAVDMHLADFA